MVAQADSTLAYIKKKVRRITASSSTSSLSDSDLEQYINQFYSQDFAYANKLDVMRSVYTFYTEPNIDRYSLDVNYNQGIRSPVYIEGIPGIFLKDRQQFYNLYPRFPTISNPINGDGITTAFAFTAQGPFLSREVVLGGVSTSGSAISVNDNGSGILQMQFPNAVVPSPVQNTVLPVVAPIPGMINKNNSNPGLNAVINIGTVNYVTGAISVDFSLAGVTPIAGQQMTLWTSQYQTGRPYTILFWNNEFTIRPVPSKIHKIEVEVYLTPVQFLNVSDNPILTQWSKYIALGASYLILQDRQDVEGIENLTPMIEREEALVLERQSVEEIQQPQITMFNTTTTTFGLGASSLGYW